MEGKEPVDNTKAGQTTTSGTTTIGGNWEKRRRKRNEDLDTSDQILDEDQIAGPDTSAGSNQNTTPGPDSVTTLRPSIKPDATVTTKYGCPVGFTRVTEYVCFHCRNDQNGKAVPSTFEASQRYCKDKGASVLYFTNNAEALKTWEWLGKSSSVIFLYY